MTVHELTLATTAITHPDTYVFAIQHLMAEEYASQLEYEHEILGHDPDDR